jgi:catechol 2,3-dioxygenase-like lactoylglutathione lyase family enzyme
MTQPTFTRAVLVLPVNDMAAARDWYARALGFSTVFLNHDAEDPEGNYAILAREGAEVHLILDEPPREHPWRTAGTGYLFLQVRNVRGVREAVLAAGVELACELRTEDWGAEAFQLLDPAGNLILVAEDLSSQA